MIYNLGYDLRSPGQNYTALINALTNDGGVRIMASAWIVPSNLIAQQVQERYRQYMDANDLIFISEITNSNWSGFILSVKEAERLIRQ